MSKLHSIHAELREKIVNGSFKENERLPTTHEMARTFGCSVGMASKVIAMLVHEGLVEQRRGLGTRVLPRATVPRAAAGQLDAFAFIYASEKHEGIWRTVRGFQDAVHEGRGRAVMLSTGTDYAREAEYLSRLTEFDVRGAAIYPVITSLKEQVQISKVLVESRFPVVLVDLHLPGLGCPSVVVDGFHAAYTMTRHLLQQGVKRVGFCANQSWALSVADRYHGYLWALEEAGIPLAPERVLLEPTMEPNYDDPVRESMGLARAYLQRGDIADGVVCANDFMARGLIRAAGEIGLAVPDKLKVTGIDDFALPAEGEMALTTYRIPFEEIGRKACAVLRAVLNKEPQGELETRVRGELVVRESA